MRRRQFPHVIGAAAAWPLVVHAQQPAKAVIGFLSSRSPRESAAHVAGFRRALAEAGLEEGRNVIIESRWADGHYERLPALARELVGLKVSVIAAVGSLPSAMAAKAATTTIPIAFVAVDPVKAGLAVSYNRPGGNVTGVDLVSGELGPKRLELMCKLLPAIKTIGLLLNRGNPGAEAHRQSVQTAATTLSRRLWLVQASTKAEVASAFEALAGEKVGGLVVQNDPFFDSRRDLFVALAARHVVPAIYHIRDFPEAGGLMSYGASLVEAYHQTGVYVGQILHGANPGDLPIQRPTRFEMVFNVKTARILGIDVSPTFLAEADEVIE